MGSWDTEEGLPDNFVLTVDNAFFATDAGYNSGNTLLAQFEGTAEFEDGEVGPLDKPVLYSCGDGWASHDGGKTAVHERGKDKFNRNSAYGQFIERIKELGVGDTLKAQGGDPTVSKTWMGLKFRFKREEKEYNIGGEKQISRRAMPVEFVGAASNGSKTSKKAAAATGGTTSAADKVAAAKAKAAAKKASTNPVEEAVREAARNTDAYDDFVETALAIDGVVDDEALLERITDADGIWAEVKA